ncbi:MAG TPA: hypothetical protein VFS43_09060 [Polyangiaceae bacterium]|nr:hypothetical protein [Polyangiaceae bacterium]
MPEGVLERARRALGFDPARLRGELLARGEGRVQGLAARVAQRLHADGRLSSRVEARLGWASGYDGRRGWSVDFCGWPGPCELEDLEVLRVVAAVWSGRWLAPGSEIEALGAEGGGDGARLTLRLRGGASRFSLSLEAGSWRPRRLDHAAGHERAWLFGEYGPGPWGPLARRVVTKEGWLQDDLAFSSVEARPGGPPSPGAAGDGPGGADGGYGPPAPDLDGTSFDDAAGASVALSLTPRGRLPIVRPALEGREVGPFLLDTGAGMLGVEGRVADALGLERCGRTWVQTAADGGGACFRVGSSLRLGPLSIARPVFVEIELAELGRALGVRLAGVCGYDLFARAIVSLRASPPGASLRRGDAPPEGLAWQPLAFEGRRPLAACASEGGEALLALDSGSSLGALLYPAGAERWGLAGRPGRPVAARGLSGSRRVAAARLAWLSVAGRRLERVPASLALEREGIAGAPHRLGVVGWGLLKRFDLVFDYGRRRIALGPGRGSPPGEAG